MTHADPADSCEVSLLVPHPRRTAVLVADETTSFDTPMPARRVRLPTFRLPSREPLLPDILASVDVVDTDTTAVLRTVVTSSGDAEDSDPGRGGEAHVDGRVRCGCAPIRRPGGAGGTSMRT